MNPRTDTLNHLTRLGLFSCLWAFQALAGAPAGLPPVFGPGEQSTYRVSYLGVRAGTAQITVGSEMQEGGKEVWPLVTWARSDSMASWFPVRDRFVSYWDTHTQETVGNDLLADENHQRRRQHVVLDPATGRGTVSKQKNGEPASSAAVSVAPGSRDITAVTFALRCRPLAVGAEYHFPVYTGAKAFDLVAQVEGTEKLETALGPRDVFRIRVKTEFSGKLASKRDMVAYFTSDPLHIPVRIEAEFVLGKLAAELTEYQPGRKLADATPAHPGR